jgi:integrase/recombinase XerD
MVEDYLFHLKATMHPNSVPQKMLGVRHFFVMNRKHLDWDVIRKMYPQRLKRHLYRSWKTEELQKMLQSTTSLRNKTLIHIMASTGARVGIFEYDLQIKHLRDMGDGCKAILLYSGQVEEYWAFLIPEASKSLDDYFEQRRQDNERLTGESPLLRQNYRLGIEKAKPLTYDAVRSLVNRMIKSAKISRNHVSNGRYDVQMDHGFRKRFNTILKLNNEVNSNITEKILGHKNGLDGVYFTPTLEQCFSEFKKAIFELTIDGSERDRLKIIELEAGKSEVEKKNEEYQKALAELKETKNEVKKVHARLRKSNTATMTDEKMLEMVKKALEQIKQNES